MPALLAVGAVVALAGVVLTALTGCAGDDSSGAGDRSVRKSSVSSQSTSVSQSSSVSVSGSGTTVVRSSTRTSTGGKAAREHVAADLGDLGVVRVRCREGGRLAMGVAVPAGGRAVDASLRAGGARREEAVAAGQELWTAFADSSKGEAELTRGGQVASVHVTVSHLADGRCTLTDVRASQHG
jgi:hypothetical protein